MVLPHKWRIIIRREGGRGVYFHNIIDPRQTIPSNGLLTESLIPGARIESAAQAESLAPTWPLPGGAMIRRCTPLHEIRHIQ